MYITDLTPEEFSYFYGTYLNYIPKEQELVAALQEGKLLLSQCIENIPEEKLGYRYKNDKWTVAEVIVHLIDTERIFQYRAFRISRNDMTPLPGFEQDAYILESECHNRTKAAILTEYKTVRDASISMYDSMPEHKLKRIGSASGMPWSVAALGFAMSGHQMHHLKILKERYL